MMMKLLKHKDNEIVWHTGINIKENNLCILMANCLDYGFCPKCFPSFESGAGSRKTNLKK